MDISQIVSPVSVDFSPYSGTGFPVFSPISGQRIMSLKSDNAKQVTDKIKASAKAFSIWQNVPPPRRGELIRLFGLKLRKYKEPLAQLVTVECGKILEEARGEVQEMIDICDFAVGLSRQLHGLTIASERPEHNMQETWYPLGPVGIISAFNFPVAVWAWNMTLAIVCGNPVIWKPSEKTPLCAIICQEIFLKALGEYRDAPENLSQIIIGDRKTGNILVNSVSVPLVSATGSCSMGSIVGPKVAGRFGRSLLELGGNNAVIVTENADLDIAVPSIVFGAVGTAGQRCTTTRRLFVHKSLYAQMCSRLHAAYTALEKSVGDPMAKETLIGPLIDKDAYENMHKALKEAVRQGGEVFFGNRINVRNFTDAYYVHPALVKFKGQKPIVKEETFAPILYIMPYSGLDKAIDMQNDVSQGLSSAIFTTDIREAELFRKRSDCGIANVNIGTSGAEIGGAFGGEKATGGGRESGSDAWKSYMRRQTSTTYYGTQKPALAQGIRFDTENL